MTVRVGLEILRDSNYEVLRGKRIGLFTHPAAVDSRLKSTVSVFRQAETRAAGVEIGAFFGAEHGITGAAAADEKVASTIDPELNVPIYSLYDESKVPTREMLEGLDAVVCDFQDVGARYFTYTWSVSHMLETAGAAGVEVIILDRPNPLGGEIVDGDLLDPALSSLVGRYPIPAQHGMTLGELACMINDEWNPTPAAVTVIPCMGWQRSMIWEQTGLVWVPPSPNTAHLSSVHHYPGACLIEGTNLSEGRGTPLPFEIIGAPFLDGTELAERLNALDWIGVRFRPIAFTPTASKWNGQLCGGVQVHLTERTMFYPMRVWLGVIIAALAQCGASFVWESGFDGLAGTKRLREQISAGAPHTEITTEWDEARQVFLKQRAPYLLYD